MYTDQSAFLEVYRKSSPLFALLDLTQFGVTRSNPRLFFLDRKILIGNVQSKRLRSTCSVLKSSYSSNKAPDLMQQWRNFFIGGEKKREKSATDGLQVREMVRVCVRVRERKLCRLTVQVKTGHGGKMGRERD